MLIVHTFPSKDPIAPFKGEPSKTDNYFRVSSRASKDTHVFPFANGNRSEISWAFAEARRVLGDLGGPARAIMSIWKRHPDFEINNVVGENLRFDEDEPGVRRLKTAFNGLELN